MSSPAPAPAPLLFDVLRGATNSWSLPLVTLFVALGICMITGCLAAAPRYVDDDLAKASPGGR